jgi:hypothetical protein
MGLGWFNYNFTYKNGSIKDEAKTIKFSTKLI